MPDRKNEFGQPIGPEVPGWTPPPMPGDMTLSGVRVVLSPLNAKEHSDDLYEAFVTKGADENWTYLSYGPFSDRAGFDAWLVWAVNSADPKFYAILNGEGRAVGVASLMRIRAEHGAIEVGHIHFSPALQGTAMGTEAMYLMMKWVFEAGYRRYEWKCNALNEPSCRAAKRLGFTYEGTFRNDLIFKGRSRDTAWFSIAEAEWPNIRTGLETWLLADNFTADGVQIKTLAECMPR